MTLGAFLASAVGPLVIRALLAVGFTAVTFAGVQTAVNGLIASAQSNWAAAPAGVIQFASLAGVPEGLGVICAAIVARLTLWVGVASTRLIFTGKVA